MFDAVIDYIARTNLFNFIIFAGIIALIFVKLNVIDKLEKGAKNVSDKIDDSTAAKEESETKLKTIEEKVANLENEVKEIISQSETNAKLVGDQILSATEKSIVTLKANTSKLIENKTEVLKNDILKRASLASVEVAREHIINELNNNYDLHNKLIDESIESINGVDIK